MDPSFKLDDPSSLPCPFKAEHEIFFRYTHTLLKKLVVKAYNSHISLFLKTFYIFYNLWYTTQKKKQ